MWLGESSVVSPHEVLAGSWRPCPWAAILLFAYRPGFIVHLWTAPGPELFRVYGYLASPIFLMIFNAAQNGRQPAVLSMLRSASTESMARSDGYNCEAAVSSGSLPSVPALCLSMQLCPPAFTTVQGGSEFHFVNIRALHKCVSAQAVVSAAVSRIGRDTRVPVGGGCPLRTQIDSELAPRAPARSGSSLGGPTGSGRLPGSRTSGDWAVHRRRVPDSACYAFRADRARTSPWCVDRVPDVAGCPRIPAVASTR